MYKKVKRDEVPKRERKSESRFASTPEWRSMRADIDKGLKKDESCFLQLAPADWERMGLSGDAPEGRNTATGTKAVRRMIQQYLESKGLRYSVRAVHSNGFDYVIVDGQ
jgi:hypothetical protein